MASPFPGINPYIESQGLWRDFHGKFLNCLQETLLDKLPEDYDARTEESVYILEAGEEEARLIIPDVAVSESGAWLSSGTSTAVATLEPVTIPYVAAGEVRERYLRILHRPTHSVVAVIEVLSPTNKSASGFAKYLEKRAEIIESPVHLVELDLLLAGQRLPMGKPLPVADFFALVSRHEERPDCHVYSWSLFDAPPEIPVPLRAAGERVLIRLADVLDLTYHRGRYERSVDYDLPLDLPLDDAKRASVAERAQSTRVGGGGAMC